MRNGGSLSAAGAKRASEPTKPNPAESWAERLKKSRRFWWSNMVRGLVGGWGLVVGDRWLGQALGHNNGGPAALGCETPRFADAEQFTIRCDRKRPLGSSQWPCIVETF